jgi:hypothetical protein
MNNWMIVLPNPNGNHSAAFGSTREEAAANLVDLYKRNRRVLASEIAVNGQYLGVEVFRISDDPCIESVITSGVRENLFDIMKTINGTSSLK